MSHQRALAGQVWATGKLASDARGIALPATCNGKVVAVLTFRSAGATHLDESLARGLRRIGRTLGRRLGAECRKPSETPDRNGPDRPADTPAAPDRPVIKLSEREREVLQLAADGYDGPAIARRLFVSPATVKTHFLHVYEKLGVKDRAGAVAAAMRQGLIT